MGFQSLLLLRGRNSQPFVCRVRARIRGLGDALTANSAETAVRSVSGSGLRARKKDYQPARVLQPLALLQQKRQNFVRLRCIRLYRRHLNTVPVSQRDSSLRTPFCLRSMKITPHFFVSIVFLSGASMKMLRCALVAGILSGSCVKAADSDGVFRFTSPSNTAKPARSDRHRQNGRSDSTGRGKR